MDAAQRLLPDTIHRLCEKKDLFQKLATKKKSRYGEPQFGIKIAFNGQWAVNRLRAEGSFLSVNLG